MNILTVFSYYVLFLCMDFLVSLIRCFRFRKLKESKEFIYSSHSLWTDIFCLFSLFFGLYVSSFLS